VRGDLRAFGPSAHALRREPYHEAFMSCQGAVRRRMRWTVIVALCMGAGLGGGPAGAQVFLASEAHPGFAIGPLFITAIVRPELNPVTVSVSWSTVTPPTSDADAAKQDLFLFWPAEVASATAPGPADPALARALEARGFTALADGRLVLRKRDRAKLGTAADSDPVRAVASYVTFYKRGTNPNQSGIGTFIKIPWSPELADPLVLANLTMPVKDMITPRPANWLEELFWGRRWVLTHSSGSVGSLALYSMYFEHRDRVVRLAPDVSLLLANFGDADHLRIEEVSPAAATRRGSRVRAGSEIVSLTLTPNEGVVPQILKVHFHYFSGRIAWRPILVSAALLLLGNLAGVFMFGQQFGSVLRRRLHVGSARGGNAARQHGVVLAADTLSDIRPGLSTYEDVVRLCGPPEEETEELGASPRRSLVYRGRRTVPDRRLKLGWVATVNGWNAEDHEVVIAFDGDRVHAVTTRVRRLRLPAGG
jgi:hypothetical protein